MENLINSNEIAKVNKVSIMVGNDKDSPVPIRPICDALGIDYKTQYDKLKDDEDLSSVMGLSPTTGGDGKVYEMVCLPLEFVFGWLFTINPKNVKPEAQATVRKYRRECYHALYEYFVSYAKFVKQKQQKQTELWSYVKQVRKEFREAKIKLSKANERMTKTVDYTYDQWKCNGEQLVLDFMD